MSTVYYTKRKLGRVTHIAGTGDYSSRCGQMNRNGYTGTWDTDWHTENLARLMERLNKSGLSVCKHCRKAAEETLYADLMPVAELLDKLLAFVNGDAALVRKNVADLLGHARGERNRVAVRYYTELLALIDA